MQLLRHQPQDTHQQRSSFLPDRGNVMVEMFGISSLACTLSSTQLFESIWLELMLRHGNCWIGLSRRSPDDSRSHWPKTWKLKMLLTSNELLRQDEDDGPGSNLACWWGASTSSSWVAHTLGLPDVDWMHISDMRPRQCASFVERSFGS